MASSNDYFQGDMGSHEPTTCSFQQFMSCGRGAADKAPAVPTADAAQGISANKTIDAPQCIANQASGSGASDKEPAQPAAGGQTAGSDLEDAARQLYLAQAPIRSEAPGPLALSALLQDIHIPAFLPQAPSEINLWMSMR